MVDVAKSGRLLTIEYDGAIIGSGGGRSKSVTFNNEPVDITADGDEGWRTLLAEAGVRSVDASCSGVSYNNLFVSKCVATGGAMLEAATVNFAHGGTLEGDFFLTSFEVTGETDGGVEFTCELQSSGELTYTAPV